MKKLILVAMFTMFASVAAARDASHEAGAREVPVLVAADAELDAEAGAGIEPQQEAEPFNDWCYDYYAGCTAECLEFIGAAKGACLRVCRLELEECLGG